MPRKKKRPEKAPNHERWLVSYADFITLLFAVFVTLYAMSQVDKKKVEEVMRSLKESFGLSRPASVPVGSAIGPIIPMIANPVLPNESQGGHLHARRPEDLVTLKAELQAFLRSEDRQREVGVQIDGRGLTISLEATTFFDPGSAQIRVETFADLDVLVTALARYSNHVRVEGFTDNTPIRSPQFPSNWELSTARATAIIHFAVDRHGLPPTRLSAAGFGEYRPRGDNRTEEGRRKNRRVDIVLLAGEGERGLP